MNKITTRIKRNDIAELLENEFPDTPSQRIIFLRAIKKFQKIENIKDKKILALFNSNRGKDELRMIKRISIDSPKIIQCLLMKFDHDLKRMLGSDKKLYSDSEKKYIPKFSTDEKLEIVEEFIKIVKMKIGNVDEEKSNEEYMKLRKKFRQRLRFSPGFRYFNSDAMQFECVGNEKWDYYTAEEWNNLPGAEAQLLTDTEMQQLLKGILHNLKWEQNFLLGKPASTKPKNVDKPTSIQGNSKSKVIPDSFKLEKTDLENLWQLLDALHKGFVSEKVKLPQFKRVFSGGIVKNKIGWEGTISALHFFIDRICKRIKNEPKKYKWEITCKCFFIEGIDLTPAKLDNNRKASEKDKDIILAAIREFSSATSSNTTNTTL